MAKLIHVTNMSLDGYISDDRGAFNLFPPDDDVFASTTDLLRSVGTLLNGRRLYETMAVWETNAAGRAALRDPRTPGPASVGIRARVLGGAFAGRGARPTA